MTTSARAVVLSLVLASTPAFAGLGSLLAKLGKAGSSAGKVAKAGSAGMKAAKLAKVGVGITGVVAAERAGFVLAGLSDDAARGAAFLAKGAEGEVVMVTRAAGTSTHSAESAALAVDALATEGRAPTVFLDKSAAASPEVVRKLPDNASLVLVEEGKTVPLRKKADGTGDLIVDGVDGAMDLADYLGASGGDEEDDGFPFGLVFGVLVLGIAGVYGLKFLRSLGNSGTPA